MKAGFFLFLAEVGRGNPLWLPFAGGRVSTGAGVKLSPESPLEGRAVKFF